MDIVKVLPKNFANNLRSKHDLYKLLRYDCKTYFNNCSLTLLEFCMHTFKRYLNSTTYFSALSVTWLQLLILHFLRHVLIRNKKVRIIFNQHLSVQEKYCDRNEGSSLSKAFCRRNIVYD